MPITPDAVGTRKTVVVWIPHTPWGRKERLGHRRMEEGRVTHQPGLGQSFFNATEGGDLSQEGRYFWVGFMTFPMKRTALVFVS